MHYFQSRRSFIISGISFSLLAALLSSLCLAALAADKSREEAVSKFEHAWADSWVKSDVKAMEHMLTEDFVEVGPDGMISTRAEHLAGFSSGKMKVQSLVLSDVKIRFYGNIAVVTGFSVDKGTYDGKDTSGKYAFTDVLIFRGGSWKAASTHATKVAP